MKKTSNVIDFVAWKQKKLGGHKGENGVWVRDWTAIECAAFEANKPRPDEYTLIKLQKQKRAK